MFWIGDQLLLYVRPAADSKVVSFGSEVFEEEETGGNQLQDYGEGEEQDEQAPVVIHLGGGQKPKWKGEGDWGVTGFSQKYIQIDPEKWSPIIHYLPILWKEQLYRLSKIFPNIGDNIGTEQFIPTAFCSQTELFHADIISYVTWRARKDQRPVAFGLHWQSREICPSDPGQGQFHPSGSNFRYLDPVLVLGHLPQMVVDAFLNVQPVLLRVYYRIGICSCKTFLLNGFVVNHPLTLD